MHYLQILHFIQTHPEISLLILFFGMFIEGDALLFICGFLIQQGLFNPVITFFVLTLGSFCGDYLWYELGAHLDRRSKLAAKAMHYFSKPFDRHLEKRTLRTLIITKFAYGLHHPVLMRAGSQQMPLKKYLKYDAISIVVWVSVVCTLGYISSASFRIAKHYFRYAEILLAIGLILFFSATYLITKYSKEHI